MTLAEAVRSHRLFASLDGEQAERMAAVCRRRTHRAGEILVHEGEPGVTLHLILDGRVEVYRLDATGQKTTLSELGPGEYFGEMSLLDGRPRSATVACLEASLFLVLERDALMRAIRSQPTIALTIIADLSRRLRQSDEWRSANWTVRQRLARFLLDQEEGAVIQQTHQSMADRIQSRRETVSRELAALAADGVVGLSRGTVRVLRPKALRRYLDR